MIEKIILRFLSMQLFVKICFAISAQMGPGCHCDEGSNFVEYFLFLSLSTQPFFKKIL